MDMWLHKNPHHLHQGSPFPRHTAGLVKDTLMSVCTAQRVHCRLEYWALWKVRMMEKFQDYVRVKISFFSFLNALSDFLASQGSKEIHKKNHLYKLV